MPDKFNQTEIEKFLPTRSVGRINYFEGKKRYVIPVTYGYDGKNIIVQTKEGMNPEIIRKNTEGINFC